jgi:uncharacterized surface protein with fasciclin (FAS1) repeats
MQRREGRKACNQLQQMQGTTILPVPVDTAILIVSLLNGCNAQIKNTYPFNRSTLQIMQTILFAVKHNHMSNIVDVVVADKNLSTLLRGVKAAGMENELSKSGPFTVFAPSEMAFGKLAQGELTDLLKPENKIKLTGLLNNHVVEGRNLFKDFKDGQKLKAVSGMELLVKVIGNQVTLNGAAIQARDHEASNGVVHSLSAVLPTV